MTAAATRSQKLLLIGFGVALVVLAEAGLRLAGFGGEPPLLVPFGPPRDSGDTETQLYEVNPAIGEIFFSRSGPGGALVGGHRRELLALPKPAGTLRVLYVGASTVEGFPMPRNLTSARFLEEMLREAVPGHRVEVLNLGVAAVASFAVRKVAERAITDCDPDLVVVYAGHNEFFGAGGVASFQFMGRSAFAREAVYALRRSALFQAASALAAGSAPAEADEETSLISIMAAVEEIEPDGELHAAARASLARNLRGIVRTARAAGVPAVVSTLVSNERGLFPIASWAKGVDGLSAELRYRRARELEDEGRDIEAAAAYRKARDLDAMPWRAPTVFNEAIRALAGEEGAVLADAEADFAKTSGAAAGGATGWRLFVDHVHPSLEGQFVLARTLFRAIELHGLLPATAGRSESWRSLSARLGAHTLEHYVLVHKMATLFGRPPIGTNNTEKAAELRALLAKLEASADPVEAAAIGKWKRASADAGFALPISFLAGAAALQAGEPLRASGYLNAAVEGSFPFSDERSAAQLLLWLAEVLSGAPPARLSKALQEYRAEADWVATLPGQPSALLAAARSGFAALGGEEAVLPEAEAAATAEPPAWMTSYLRELPELPELVQVGRQVTRTPGPSSPG